MKPEAAPASQPTRWRSASASSPAWRRLELWAEMFEPTSRGLLASAPEAPELALDLGCALGHTTRLIAGTLRPRRTVGLDRAPAYVQSASRAAPAGVAFLEHDVTEVPFPVGPAELIYCRLLLPHLEQPTAVVSSWATQLRPGGRLLIDEVEAVEGDLDDDGPVHHYLEIAAALQARHGPRPPEVGALLGAASWTPPFRCLSNSVVTLRPALRVLVPAVLLNLRAWARDPFCNSTYPEPVLRKLEGNLQDLARTDAAAPISWQLRQVVLQREAGS